LEAPRGLRELKKTQELNAEVEVPRKIIRSGESAVNLRRGPLWGEKLMGQKLGKEEKSKRVLWSLGIRRSGSSEEVGSLLFPRSGGELSKNPLQQRKRREKKISELWKNAGATPKRKIFLEKEAGAAGRKEGKVSQVAFSNRKTKIMRGKSCDTG